MTGIYHSGCHSVERITGLLGGGNFLGVSLNFIGLYFHIIFILLA